MDAHTEAHDPIGGELIVSFGHLHLHCDRSFDRADHAGKLEQKAVPGVLHDPAAVIEDDRVYRASMGFERSMRPCLVGAHHAGIAGDVGADYRG
jgi:hypothetical protein